MGEDVSHLTRSMTSTTWSAFDLFLKQIEALQCNISSYIALPGPSRLPPTRVFQIQTTPTHPIRPSSTIFTWPPSRPRGSGAQHDGKYDADEYSDLIRGIDLVPAQRQSTKGEIRTSCTTRFGAKHSITTEGVYRHVTSVFIPYGNLIFCCFQTTKQVEIQPRSPINVPIPQSQMQGSYSGGVVNAGNGNELGSGGGGVGSYGMMGQQPDWSVGLGNGGASSWPRPDWGLGRTTQNALDHWPSSSSQRFNQQQQQQHRQSLDQSLNNIPLQPEPLSPFGNHPSSYPSQTSSHDISRTYPTPSSSAPYSDACPSDPYPSDPYPSELSPLTQQPSVSATTEPTSAVTRPLVPPPGNITRCRLCGLRQSPEWRRSESGVKDLCNA